MPKILALLIISGCFSCASNQFKYQYYALGEMPDACYETPLFDSPHGKDINFLICKPDPDHKSKCVVMDVVEFLKLKQDLLQCRSDLDSAQRAD